MSIVGVGILSNTCPLPMLMPFFYGALVKY